MRKALVILEHTTATEPRAAGPQTKAEAIASGQQLFFTGKPCRNGHIAMRKAPSGRCVQCQIEQNARERDQRARLRRVIEEAREARWKQQRAEYELQWVAYARSQAAPVAATGIEAAYARWDARFEALEPAVICTAVGITERIHHFGLHMAAMMGIVGAFVGVMIVLRPRPGEMPRIIAPGSSSPMAQNTLFSKAG